MSSESIEITGVGEQLRDEIQSGDFDRFVVFSYGITSEYLEWFDESDLIAICGPNETVKTVREESRSPFVSAFNRPTHAKIYLLYNEDRMVAYLGSFNFTRNGLFGGVEWGARYEGELVETPPNPSTLVDGGARTEISTSPMIEQILTIVGASMTGEDTDAADSWVANTGIGEGVVHTLRSNTLQTALSDLVRDAEGTIHIRYYTPFITYEGISEFISYLPDGVAESEIELTVLTKRLDRVGDDEEMLAPEQIDRFDEQFGAFRLRVRAPGNQGNELPDGRELRSGMAHLKAISLSDEKPSSTEGLGVILTSANLSKRAWNRTSAGFEVGVAVTGTADSRRLHRFFSEHFPQCYVEPSDTVLSTAAGRTTTRSRGTEEWLDERLRDGMAIEADTVSVTWDDSLPVVNSLEGSVSIRNIESGARTNHSVVFQSTEEGYQGSFPSVSEQPNQIIDFVRVIAESRHAPPELVFSAREVHELRTELSLEDDSDPLPEDWLEFDEIIWNNEVRTSIDDGGFSDVDIIKSVRLLSNHDTLEPNYAIYEPEQQPHIDHAITHMHIGERQITPLGTLVRLDINTHPLISLDPTDFRFYTSHRHQIEPLGFATDQETLRYYFSPDAIGESLRVRLQSLASRYIQGTSMEIETNSISATSSVQLSDHVSMEPWFVTPKDADPVLSKPRSQVSELLQTENQDSTDQVGVSNEMEAEVSPSDELLSNLPSDRLSVWWRPSGTFRSGTLQPISATIPKQEPRTRVTYRGIVTIQDGDEQVNFWLPGGDYLVKEQPFVETLNVSLQAIPTEQNLDHLRASTLLGWIVLQQDDLLKQRARDVPHCINPQLYLNGKMIPRQIFGATKSGGILCIPILGEHVGTTLDASLRTWISDGPAKTTHYAEAVRKLGISVTRDGSDITIEVSDQTRHITHVDNGEKPLLEPFSEIILKNEFERQTKAEHPDELFRIQSYSPLHIIPNEMLLLHFTDQ